MYKMINIIAVSLRYIIVCMWHKKTIINNLSIINHYWYWRSFCNTAFPTPQIYLDVSIILIWKLSQQIVLSFVLYKVRYRKSFLISIINFRNLLKYTHGNYLDEEKLLRKSTNFFVCFLMLFSYIAKYFSITLSS